MNEGMYMIGVFRVVAVDRRTNEILVDKLVTAVNAGAAMLKVDVADKARVANGEIHVGVMQLFNYAPIVPAEYRQV